MKNPTLYLRSNRGSAFITVIFLLTMMALLTAGILKYSSSERRSNERQRLLMRARNMAENVALYSSEQITNKLYKLRNLTPRKFATGANQVYLPPDTVLTTAFSAPADAGTFAGLTTSTALALISDPSSANNGLQVATGNVQIIAKSTMTHPSIGPLTVYAEQDLEVTEIPLFQFAIFYNQDLEINAGGDLTVSGPVHANGDLIIRGQSGKHNTIEFQDRVTGTGGLYAKTTYKGITYNETGGADDGSGSDGPLNFKNVGGTETSLFAGGIWQDHFYSANSNTNAATPTATQLSQFKANATSTYGTNLKTSVHGVTALVLPGTDSSALNRGRYIIEPPDTADTPGIIQNKFSRRAGLYIIVNPDDEDRTGTKFDATTVTMRARSYRCWLNTVNADGTHTPIEVVLPGQPSYGDSNAIVNDLPNAYRVDTSVGSNQVLRIPKGGGVDRAGTGYADSVAPSYNAGTNIYSFQDAFFYDLRRATNSNGSPFTRGTNTFAPRPISKIDFDMTRFKMAVDRTLSSLTSSSVYNPNRPNKSIWAASLLNSGGVPAAHGLGTGSGYNVFAATDSVDVIQRTQNGIYAPGQITISGSKQTGATAIAAYAGRFIVEETVSADPFSAAVWNVVYTSTVDESTGPDTPTAGITGVRISMYLAGAAPTAARLLDQQIIPITVDNAAVPAVTASLSSDLYVVPSTSNTGGFLLTNAYTDMKVYVGGIDDTANWTFTATIGGSAAITSGGFGLTSGTVLATGTYGNGPGHNRYWVTGISTTNSVARNTGTVTITAARSGYANVSRTFTVTKQSAIAAMAPNNDQSSYWLTVTNSVGADPFKIYRATGAAVTNADLFSTSAACPWFDGITVYIDSVDAESTAGKVLTAGIPARLDSGVRIINGRGSVPSVTTPGYTGLSFVTNDALYLIGHYNADGTTQSDNTITTNPGGYSGRYPETNNEYLSAVMSDATTIVSQPAFTESGAGTVLSPYVYTQTGGWSDALSANVRSNPASGYSTSWQTTNPSGANSMDGTNQGVVPPPTPWQGNSPAFPTGTAATYKLTSTVTEISSCLITGIVPTDSHQNSGGAHNFPRMLENWNASGLFIRGSMVAMFTSLVGTEPWSIRIYSAPTRNWGLHQSLRNANHDVPLEPILLQAQRLHYSQITADEYNTLKSQIQALSD